MDLFIMILCILTIIMGIYAMIITPYKQGYKGLKGLIKYGKMKNQEAKEYNEQMKEKMLAEYDELKKQSVHYTKMLDEFLPADEISSFMEKEFEADWHKATFHKNISKRVEYARKVVNDLKSMYEYMKKTKKEYFEIVNGTFNSASGEDIGVNEIREKFTTYYSYNDSAYESYIQAMKQIVNDIEHKQHMYDAATKRGIDSIPLSLAEEVLLPSFNKTVAEYEKQKEEEKRIEREKAMLAQMEELQRGQQRQMEQFAKSMSKK